MEILKTTLDVLNWIAVHIPWDIVLASGVLSPLLVAVKGVWNHKLDKKLKDGLMFGVLTLASFLTAAVMYILNTPTSDPGVIALQGALIAFGSQPIYYIVVKPLCSYIVAKFRAEVDKAAAYNAELKSAVLPPSGLPKS